MRTTAVRLLSALSLVILCAGPWLADEPRANGVRGRLQPKALALLAQADARLDAGDHEGALNAYIEAVKADRAAASLEAIRRYAPPAFDAAPPPPPPPPSAREASADQHSARPGKGRGLGIAAHRAALDQYLEIHPGHFDAERDLVVLLPPAEADALADALVRRHPRDPEIYKLRSLLRFRAARYTDGVADLEQAALLAPGDANLFYQLGVVAYEMVSKRETAPLEKRDLIARGVAALNRAESLRADYLEALVYRSLLLREQAKLESDPAMQQRLIAEADAARGRAMEIVKARRGQPVSSDTNVQTTVPGEATPITPIGGGALRVGGDVKAPLVMHRVDPVIPEAARKARVAGIVILEALIDTQGMVKEARVLKALPFGLDQAALEAVRQWTFEPGTLHGQPVDVIFNLTVNIKPE